MQMPDKRDLYEKLFARIDQHTREVELLYGVFGIFLEWFREIYSPSGLLLKAFIEG